MGLSSFLLNPMNLMIIKMGLVFMLVFMFTKFRLSATNQAWVWRLGLLFLLSLPVLSNQLNLLNIPVAADLSPELMTSAKDDLNANLAQANQADHIVVDSLPPIWLPVIAVISTLLLFKLYSQYQRLQRLTAAARPSQNPAQLKRIKQTAQSLNLKRLPTVLYSNSIQSPSTWGLFKPVILLPNQTQSDLSIILLHEMAHIKRHDWAWMMAAKITTAIFWFNPFLWLVKNKLIASFESACDEMVLSHQIKPSVYAETLLYFHNQHRDTLSSVTTSMAQPSQMYQRLEHILNPELRSKTMQIKKQRLILLTGALTMSLVATSQLTLAHDDEHITFKHAAPHPEQPAPVIHSNKVPHPDQPVRPDVHPAHPVTPAADEPPSVPTPAVLPTAPTPPHANDPRLEANELALEMKLEHVHEMGLPLEKLEHSFELAHQRIEHASQDIHPVLHNVGEAEQQLSAVEKERLQAQLNEVKALRKQQQSALAEQELLIYEKAQAVKAQKNELQRQLETNLLALKEQERSLTEVAQQANQLKRHLSEDQSQEIIKLKRELAQAKAELADIKAQQND